MTKLVKPFAAAAKIGAVAFFLIILLFFNGSTGNFFELSGLIFREVSATFANSLSQRLIFLCLGIYFANLFCRRLRMSSEFSAWMRKESGTNLCVKVKNIFPGATEPAVWIAGGLLIGALRYTMDYTTSIEALILIAGAVLGQGVAFWAASEGAMQESPIKHGISLMFISNLIFLLTLVSIADLDSRHSFIYHNEARWTGPWDNPNMFGVFMGTGMVLAMGMMIQSLKSNNQSQRRRTLRQETACRIRETNFWARSLGAGKSAITMICCLGILLMARGLLHSYSRGAWIATLSGAFFLGLQSGCLELKNSGNKLGKCVPSLFLWFQKSWFLLAIILVSIFILAFWHLVQTQWHPAHRAFSAVNPADFSWRNRVLAWEGALQITAEHPWLGAGWNQPEALYNKYYLPPKLTSSLAIVMNDYLLLGATLGLPALTCFGIYFWLSLFPRLFFNFHGISFLSITCRAGAMVLLVGFWFDGGMLKLPTAATFWILLELGGTQLAKKPMLNAGETSTELLP